MLHIPKIDDYLEIFTDEEVKDFVAKNLGETIRKAENLRKVTKALYIFLLTPDERHQILLIIVCVTIMLRFWIFLIINKLVIKNKLKDC